jgi:aminopeptidase N
VAVFGAVAGLSHGPGHDHSGGAQFRSFDPYTAPAIRRPVRQFDLQHVRIELDIDYPNRTLNGKTTLTFVPLNDIPEEWRFDGGSDINILSTTLNGNRVESRREGRNLWVAAAKESYAKEQTVQFEFRVVGPKGGPFGQGGGFHFIERQLGRPDSEGFWTQGQTEFTHLWTPIYDFPDDFATSETLVTVPAEWTVIANGKLVEVTPQSGGAKKTFHHRMEQPHATYLISMVGGRLHIEKDKYRDIPLQYATAPSRKALIPNSFDDTPKMMAFLESFTGIPYPYVQYSQSAMADFSGGMENITATTIGEISLSDKVDGYRLTSDLNMHELAHQWFGNLVTCEDWSHNWLNEGFASYFEVLYLEHDQSKAERDRKLMNFWRSYLREAGVYQRPLVWNRAPNSLALFDTHAYQKGALVLHALHELIGEAAFRQGIRLYLEKNRNQPVVTDRLKEAMETASGRDLAPFFTQFVQMAGHPVLEYTWAYDAPTERVRVTVSQRPSSPRGPASYDLMLPIGLFSATEMRLVEVDLNQPVQVFEIPFETAPRAVVLDPDHNYPMQISGPQISFSGWTSIALYSPFAPAREEAIMRLAELGQVPDEVWLTVLNDSDRFPVFLTWPERRAGEPGLQQFLEAQLRHESSLRRTFALVQLQSQSPEQFSEALEDYQDRVETLTELGAWLDLLEAWRVPLTDQQFDALMKRDSYENRFRWTALRGLALSRVLYNIQRFESALASSDPKLQDAALEAARRAQISSPAVVAAIGSALTSSDAQLRARAVIGARRFLAEFQPQLQRMAESDQDVRVRELALASLPR